MAYRFDIAFSFAGPHRDKVRAIAELVAANLGREKVFFDEWYRAEILGGNMRVLLQRIYCEKSLMVIADLSDDYADRPWCQGEAEAIDALRMRIDSARDETARLRVFIVRFGPGSVPGVLDNTGWLDGANLPAEEIAGVILERLHLLKQRLAEEETAPSLAQSIPPSPTPLPDHILFFHPATNDDLYSRRERELAWLDGCAKDPGIRIATVTGVGGFGKTSLVGHWIEKTRGWQHRAFRGVFFYSFYSDRDPEHFFAAFLQFVCERENLAGFPADRPLHHLAAAAVRKWCYLVVLDGLEVLQHDESDPHYGWINDGALNEFVARAGADGPSLLVLTSRFPFPEITREHPEAARACELPLLTDDEGADLLAHCGLDGGREKLRGYSHQFGGHPLALRLFAGACLAQPFDEPKTVSRHLLAADTEEGDEDPHRRQFRKLLLWLQKKLPAPKRRLLQLVALFREPVPTATLAALATGLDAMKADFADCDEAHLRFLLDALVRDHLLQREEAPGSDTARWAAHPIVREVFRTEALWSDSSVAWQFSRIIAGNEEAGVPKSIAELLPILEAIEVLLAVWDCRPADRLYRDRLQDGNVFHTLSLPQEALRCARGFFEPQRRREILVEDLGSSTLAYYLNEAAVAFTNLGDLDNSEKLTREKNKLRHGEEAWDRVCIGLRNLAHTQSLRGALSQSLDTIAEAFFYCGRESEGDNRSKPHFTLERPSNIPKLDFTQAQHCRNSLAWAHTLGGKLSLASQEFTAVDASWGRMFSKRDFAFSLPSGSWCHHCFLLGALDLVRRLLGLRQKIFQRLESPDDWHDYHLLAAAVDFAEGHQNAAIDRVADVVRTLRRAGQVSELPEALLAQARMRRSVDDCEEALRLTQRSGFALMECEALNLRALLRRDLAKPDEAKDAAEKAREDARQALEIAERCGYYWGRHEALRQLRGAAKAQEDLATFNHWDEAEKALAAKMKPEIEEALRINREHDEAMEKLYGK